MLQWLKYDKCDEENPDDRDNCEWVMTIIFGKKSAFCLMGVWEITYVGESIDVVEHEGEYYIINGHHRKAATQRTNTNVKTNVVKDGSKHTSNYQTVQEVVKDAALAGPNRLNPPRKYK